MSDTATTTTGNGSGAAADGGLVARLAAQRSKFKAAWQGLQSKVTALEKTVSDLTAERDKLSVQADTSLAAKKVDELTAQIRGMKARQAFDQAALKAGANPAALEDLWKLSEVKTDADEPDAAAIGRVIEAQKTARAWAFGPPAPANGQQTPPPPKPAAGSGQGGTVGAPAIFSDEQLQDVKYVFSNFDKISQAAQERLARGEI